MDNIIELSARRRDGAGTPASDGPAAIIIFPGIRYERRDDPGAADGPREGRKPVPDRRTS